MKEDRCMYRISELSNNKLVWVGGLMDGIDGR